MSLLSKWEIVSKYGLRGFFVLFTAFGILCDQFSLPWFTYLLYFVFFTGLAALYVLWTADLKDINRIKWYALAATLPYIVMLLASLFIWYSTQQEMTYIARGVSRILFQLIAIAFCCASCILFKEDALYMFLYGIVLGNGLLVLKVVAANGSGAFISAFFLQILGGGEDEIPIMRALEIHDVTFAFGTYILFFITQYRKVRHPLLHIFIASIFFAIGFKRIAILSIAMLVVVYAFLRIARRVYQLVIALIGAAIALISACYVVMIKEKIFDMLVEMLGINTMGRMDLYDMFIEKYDISIGFAGYGMGWTTRLIATWYEKGIITHNFGSLHNDILTMYLEIGFAAFFLWLIAELYLKNRLTGFMYGPHMEILTFILGLYTYITYFSDNTHFYSCTQAVLYLLPMAFDFERGKQNELHSEH